MNEIRTRAEVVGDLPNSLPEPMVSVGALTELLRAAAALERAQNPAPIVLHTASVPAVQEQNSALAPASTQLAQLPGAGNPGHPGIDVPVPPSVGWAPIKHRAPSRPGWGLRLVYAGMAATLTGAASAGATDGNAGTVALAAAGLLATIGGIAQAVNENSREA